MLSQGLFRAVRVHVRHRVFSASTVSQDLGIFRLMLPAVMKCIHPDLYLAYGKDVQGINAECTKNIIGLWRSLQEMEEKITKAHRHGLILPPVLASSYSLKCFVEDESAKSGLRRVSLDLKVPPELMNRAPLRLLKSRELMTFVCRQLIPFLRELQIDVSPMEKNLATIDAEMSNGSNMGGEGRRRRDGDGFGSDLTERLQLRVQERMSELNAQNTIDWNYMDTYDSMSLQGDDLQREVKRFIASGNVLIRRQSTLEEVRALQRLEKFFLSYGNEIQFSIDEWWRAIFVLDGASSDYSAENVDGRVILSIPATFKNKHLLRFLLNEVDLTVADYYF